MKFILENINTYIIMDLDILDNLLKINKLGRFEGSLVFFNLSDNLTSYIESPFSILIDNKLEELNII